MKKFSIKHSKEEKLGNSLNDALKNDMSQMSEEELRRRCQAVIDNSGTLEDTKNALEALLKTRSPL